MSSMMWMFARGFTTPILVSAFAAAGVTSGLLVWTTRRTDTHTHAKLCRMERSVANLAGELSILRDESDCRWEMQRIFATDREHARLFGKAKEDLNGMG